MEVETQALRVGTTITGAEVLDWTKKRQVAELIYSSPFPSWLWTLSDLAALDSCRHDVPTKMDCALELCAKINPSILRLLSSSVLS